MLVVICLGDSSVSLTDIGLWFLLHFIKVLARVEMYLYISSSSMDRISTRHNCSSRVCPALSRHKVCTVRQNDELLVVVLFRWHDIGREFRNLKLYKRLDKWDHHHLYSEIRF
jgi:hypothetical protein